MTDLEALLNAAIDMVDFLIEQTPTLNGGMIRIAKRFATDLPQVSVLPNQLKHVIANLLMNAREAMADGGELTIEMRKTHSSVEISVADQGAGVPQEIIDKIFDPFFTTKANGNRPGTFDGPGRPFANAWHNLGRE